MEFRIAKVCWIVMDQPIPGTGTSREKRLRPSLPLPPLEKSWTCTSLIRTWQMQKENYCKTQSKVGRILILKKGLSKQYNKGGNAQAEFWMEMVVVGYKKLNWWSGGMGRALGILGREIACAESERQVWPGLIIGRTILLRASWAWGHCFIHGHDSSF